MSHNGIDLNSILCHRICSHDIENRGKCPLLNANRSFACAPIVTQERQNVDNQVQNMDMQLDKMKAMYEEAQAQNNRHTKGQCVA